MGRVIRPAESGDLCRINDIYNHYVRESTCTYQEDPETLDARIAWFDAHGHAHPVIVVELDGQVAGWGALSPFHARSAYRFSVENSIYVDRAWHRQGIGGLILADLVARARFLGYRAIIAGIDEGQSASVALHARFGFERVGHLRQVGYKFDRWLDVIYMQLLL